MKITICKIFQHFYNTVNQAITGLVSNRTFCVSLHHDLKITMENDSALSQTEQNNEYVLVIDDEKKAYEMIAESLQKKGFITNTKEELLHLLCFKNDPENLQTKLAELLKNKNLVAVITDYNLGWTTWIDIIQSVKKYTASNKLKDPIYIGMSWNTDKQEEFKQEGVNEFVYKPHSYDMWNILHKLLTNKPQT